MHERFAASIVVQSRLTTPSSGYPGSRCYARGLPHVRKLRGAEAALQSNVTATVLSVALAAAGRGEDCMNEHADLRRARPVSTERAGVTVTRVGANLGAEIHGVNLGRPLTDAQFAAIESALVDNELIIFRNQEISSEDLMCFGRRFGELTIHPFAPSDGTAPELIKFRNDETSPPFGTDVWHSDETFRAEPPMATVLCAKEVPEIGGDTMFVSMSAAYEGLSERMRQYISGLEAVHDLKPFRTLFGDGEEDRRNLQRFELLYPPQAHPVVRVHHVSGRKVLFVNPQFTIAIKGMDERESRSLLDTLLHQALVPQYRFRLQWAPHTIAMWDNRSTQHYAIHDYYPQRRYMERVTIRGGPVIGVDRADPAEVRKTKFSVPEGVDRHGGHKPQPQVPRT